MTCSKSVSRWNPNADVQLCIDLTITRFGNALNVRVAVAAMTYKQ